MKSLIIALLLSASGAWAQDQVVDSGKKMEVKILTWNIYMMPKPVNFTKQKERAQVMADSLPSSGYDVIFMQEAFRKKTRKVLKSGLEQTYPYQYVLRKDKKLKHILGPGLMIASKYPFKVLDQVYFKNCMFSDCFASKAAVLIELELPNGKKAHIVTTHMQAWDVKPAKAIRVKQLTQIKEMLDKYAQPGVAQILTGDLNIDGKIVDDEYLKALELMEMVSDKPIGDLQYTNGFPVNCYKIPFGKREGEWLDHVWISPQGSKATIINRKVTPMMGVISGKETPISDHYALEATLVLEE